MKKFYSWYKKHITAAIFTGLILGIITGLFLANRFEPVLAITSLIGSIYMNALNIRTSDISSGFIFAYLLRLGIPVPLLKMYFKDTYFLPT